MIFNLSRKKPLPAPDDGGAQHPCACQPSAVAPARPPFEEVARLTGPYEDENVSLARCATCHRPALHYFSDIFDDHWQYWCTIDETQNAHLLEKDDPDDPQRPARARAILEKQAHLVRHPGRGLGWAPAGSGVMRGPPW